MRFEQVQRFILAKKIFWGEGHFKIQSWREREAISAVDTLSRAMRRSVAVLWRV